LLLSGCRVDQRVPQLRDASSLVVAMRVSPITYNPDSDERQTPFEHALLLRLAEHLGKSLEIIPLRSDQDVIEYVATGRAHLGAAWFMPFEDKRILVSNGFHFDRMMLVQQDPSVALDSIDELSGKAIHLPEGSMAGAIINRLRQTRVPSLTIIERPDGSGVGTLRSVAEHNVEYSAAPADLANIAQSYFPEMLVSLPLTEKTPIVWVTANRPDNEVLKATNAFIVAISADGSLSRLRDSHFSFRRRLTPLDSIRFIERINTVLPQYHALFKQAQIRTGIDWRLIAALAYQESQWDPNATSPTNVRGMMMLTEDTADRLRVSNRLDAKESILAGADYLSTLRDELPNSVEEPDRTWFALAAYNLGMGHLKGARAFAGSYKLNPDTWYDMKKMLPMLSRPEVYERLKSGRARGGEAVILVENVRAYYDILSRHQPAYSAIVDQPEVKAIPGPARGPGLKLPPGQTLRRPLQNSNFPLGGTRIDP